jgi:putative copper resistance protein D
VYDPLIYAHAIHYAATLLVAGVVFSTVFVSDPAFRQVRADTRIAAVARCWNRWMAWAGLAFVTISGATWLVLTAAAMSDQSPTDVISDGVLWTVLTQTTFGHDWLVRLVLACGLAATLAPFFSEHKAKPSWLDGVVATIAASLAGSLAWAGHAAGGLGSEAFVHPAADVLHLLAAAAWVGTLPPLLVLLSVAGGDETSVAIARTATLRFSSLGIASVATLVVTGAINTWYLAGTLPALTETDYGRLLLEKVAVFLGMVMLAATNRQWLMPQLMQNASVDVIRGALFQLRYHVAIEIAAGACVIVIVAVLGTLHPGLHLHAHVH